ncbi:hypothetical protein JCM30237_25640 [Halolamina litorea]|uniref:Metal-dependent hydrolase n=1 Tax=Halolamina litorea TaxID=1515593 RepID=A0ABD6BV01_9EURY|nr:metal-dependent hydrolase [Halolamina litorea]
MWPWDHVAAGYLLLSALHRLGWRRPPSRRAAVVVAGAAVLPDLIDKPLSWWLAVLPSGRSLGHSLLVALPLVAVVAAVGLSTERRSVALAFGAGYLSHLAGDVAYPLLVKGELRVGFLLWPLVPADSSGAGGGLPYLTDLVDDFIGFLSTPAGALYAAADLTLLGLALLAWVVDGRTAKPHAGSTVEDG